VDRPRVSTVLSLYFYYKTGCQVLSVEQSQTPRPSGAWTGHPRGWIRRDRQGHPPVKRGLVASPELWRWSSFRAYFLGETGLVRVNEWEVLKMKMPPPAA
jgi:hypothetical protein